MSIQRKEKAWLLAAFASVYILWGSTYLAIRYAIETIPPFLMAGIRFILAGLILCGWARVRGSAWPTARQWRIAAITSCMLFVGGNGAVVWAEQRVPSSLAALFVAVAPLVTVLLDWLRPGGTRPDVPTQLGLLIGFIGVVLLINPGAKADAATQIDPLGLAVLAGGTLAWSLGSLYSRYEKGSDSPFMAAGANMLAGGLGLLILAWFSREFTKFAPHAISVRSVLALLYLVIFGALVGFTAYMWLLRHTTAAKAMTYAYVNPVVALILGWAIADEPITLRICVSALIIIMGVIAITTLKELKPFLKKRRSRT